MSTDSRNNWVVVLFGPTAVGKTELVTEVFADRGEIISADALQVYRGLDIGTAKPGAEERARIPHHLIDIRDPSEPFTVGDFVTEADLRAEEILSRGKVPLVAGGSAFYLSRFLYGLPHTPPGDEEVRREIDKRAAREGWERLYNELNEIDPQSAGRIHLNDTYRIHRALEVYYTSGCPLSSFEIPSELRRKWKFLIIELTRNREELYRRIDARVEKMWELGLVEEVRGLIDSGYGEQAPGMKGIGYREFFDMRRSGEKTFEDVKSDIQKHSRRYAKRQTTFFKKIDNTHACNPENKKRIEELTQDFLGGYTRTIGEAE